MIRRAPRSSEPGGVRESFLRQLQLDRLTMRQMCGWLLTEDARRAAEVAASATEATYERLALALFGVDRYDAGRCVSAANQACHQRTWHGQVAGEARAPGQALRCIGPPGAAADESETGLLRRGRLGARCGLCGRRLCGRRCGGSRPAGFAAEQLSRTLREAWRADPASERYAFAAAASTGRR